MLLYWLIFTVIVFCAFYDIKKTIIVWIPIQLLFNDAVALKYSTPILSLIVCVNFILPLIFYGKVYVSEFLRRNIEHSTYLFKPLFIMYVISYLLSIVFSIVPLTVGTFNTILKFFTTNFILVSIFQQCVKNKEDIALFLRASIALLVILSADSVYEVITEDNPVLDYIYLNCPNAELIKERMFYVPPFLGGERQIRYGMVRAYSFFGIHIAYGCTCILLLFLFLFCNHKQIISRKISRVAIFMSLFGVLACNSKTPLVGLCVFIFAFYSIKDIVRPKTLIPLIAVCIMILIFVPSMLDNLMSLFDSSLAEDGGGSTVDGRAKQFDVVKRLFYMNPLFGNGVGSISAMYDIGNNADILGAESSWFQILPERGLFGCFVYVLWYLYSYIMMVKIVPRRIVFFLLLGLLAMETATGYLNMCFYSSIMIVIYRYYQIHRYDNGCISRINRVYD